MEDVFETSGRPPAGWIMRCLTAAHSLKMSGGAFPGRPRPILW